MSVFNQKMSVLVLDLHVYGHCLLTFISFGWDVQHQTVKTLIRLYMHLRVIHFISITVWMNFQTGVLKPNNVLHSHQHEIQTNRIHVILQFILFLFFFPINPKNEAQTTNEVTEVLSIQF